MEAALAYILSVLAVILTIVGWFFVGVFVLYLVVRLVLYAWYRTRFEFNRKGVDKHEKF